MGRFFQNIQLDRLSFWIGFLAATIFWWLLARMRPTLWRLWGNLLARLNEAREGRRATTEFHHRNDTILYAQSLHIAAPLFSLDEILIPPTVLAPPAPTQPGEAPPTVDITDLVLPYMPDWPHLGALYNAPQLSLEEALEEGANLLILGEPGSGKTVALAYLASRVARQETIEKLSQRVPLLIHAANLISQFSLESEDVLQPMITSAQQNAGKHSKDRLSQFLHTSFETGRMLVLLDGLDELPPGQIDQVAGYLSELLDRYPPTQFVTTASWDYIDGFTRLGFFPLALTPWCMEKRQKMIDRWSKLWEKYIEVQYAEERETVDPLLMNAWLRDDQRPLTPMELTLKVWASYAGDLVGPSAIDAVEAYILRMTANIPDAKQVLNHIASQMVLNQRTTILEDALQIEGAFEGPDGSEQTEDINLEESHIPVKDQADDSEIETIDDAAVRRMLPDLEQAGVIRQHSDGHYSFVHPVLIGYLAAGSPNTYDNIFGIQKQTDWLGKTLTLAYLSAQLDTFPTADRILEDDNEPLHWELFSIARWLRYAERKRTWHNIVLRELASILRKDAIPMGLKARAISALALTASISGADTLLRKLLDSPDSGMRQLAILGCGYTRDTKSVLNISESLADPQPNLRRAACLALVAIGDSIALEAVAESLLHGDEETQRAAAEAFANHPEEGYPALQDATGMDELLVRRAAVFGLQRVAKPWSIELLERIQVEDEQWMVKDAATLSLQILSSPNPRVPKPRPSLTETPWFLAFAGELGIGVAPGEASQELLFQVLREGSEEQKLAALETILFSGTEKAILPIYHLYYADQKDIREMAYLTMSFLRASGIEPPPPAQYGLGMPQR